MSIRELPSIGSSSYTTSAIGLASFGSDAIDAAGAAMPRRMSPADDKNFWAKTMTNHPQMKPEEKEFPMAVNTRRLVQIVIADPDPKMPLNDSLLYKGDEMMTDLTNEELFYELDIKGLLAAHNAKRVTVVDKTVKDRTKNLEPTRVRELKMVVVEIAKF